MSLSRTLIGIIESRPTCKMLHVTAFMFVHASVCACVYPISKSLNVFTKALPPPTWSTLVSSLPLKRWFLVCLLQVFSLRLTCMISVGPD